MTNVTAVGKDGTNNYGMSNWSDLYMACTIYADHSTFEGSTNSIENYDMYEMNTFYIGASKLAEGAASTAGTWHCINSYDGSHNALDSFCQ